MMDWTDVHYRELARMISRYKGVAMGVCVVEGGVYGYGEGGGGGGGGGGKSPPQGQGGNPPNPRGYWVCGLWVGMG